MKLKRFKEFIMYHLRAFRNTVTYRLEEYLTSKDFALFFCCPRTRISKEQFIYNFFEFFVDLGIKIYHFFTR